MNDELDEKLQRELNQAYNIPYPIFKSTYDEFDYMIGLKSGDIIRYTKAKISECKKWLIIDHDSIEPRDTKIGNLKFFVRDEPLKKEEMFNTPTKVIFDRGINIRIEDISWCVDAPFSS